MKNELDWVFEVDECDDPLGNETLLEELDIDAKLLCSTVVWMLFYPWSWFCCSGGQSQAPHPLSTLSSHREFWGPFGVISLYGTTLWVSKVPVSSLE
jgi:hypothetical protein